MKRQREAPPQPARYRVLAEDGLVYPHPENRRRPRRAVLGEVIDDYPADAAADALDAGLIEEVED